MPKLKIDGNEYEYRPGMTVIQVCDVREIERRMDGFARNNKRAT